MKSIVVVGAQWGDEGKGKVVDYLAASFDYIARCAGGHNAGHTVIYSGKRFVLHLIFPYHRQMEKAAEAARGAWKIGTTSRGIGPAYEDKMARHGIRVGHLLNPARFRERLERVIADKDAVCRATYGVPLDTTGMAEEYLALGERLRPLIGDASVLINNALDAGRSVLFEGAQGTMLDIDFGTYPFVTSSN